MYGLAKYQEGLVCPLVGQSEQHTKTLDALIKKKLFHISLQETDILVSSNMVSLFTKVPVNDTSQLLNTSSRPSSDRFLP
jgi:hypothetical protein